MTKKLLFLLIVLVLVLSGCSSTNPTLKEVYLKNQQQNNVSGTTQVTFNTNLFEVADISLSNDDKLMLDLLKSGVLLETSVQDDDTAYFKLSFKDAAALKNSEFWNDTDEPFAEVFFDGYRMLGRTSSEDKFINFTSNPEFKTVPVLTSQQKQELEGLIKKLLIQYVEEFNYELKDIKYIGKETVQTPEGNKQARHIQVKMDIEEIQQFISYTLGNLADSDLIESFITSLPEVFTDTNELNLLTDNTENVANQVKEIQRQLLIAKQYLDEFDLKSLAKQEGVILDGLVTLDYYVEDSGLIVASNENVNVDMKPIAEIADIFPPVFLKLNISSMYYNYNKVDLDVPFNEDTYDYYKLLTDYDELQKLSKTSFVRSMIEENNYYHRPASVILNIGSTKALINNNPKIIYAAPTIKNGTTLVPIRVITDITGSDIEWKEDIKSIQFNYNSNNILLKAGSTIALVNGRSVKLPVAPTVTNGVTYVPLRFVSENLDANVEYNKELNQIKIDF